MSSANYFKSDEYVVIQSSDRAKFNVSKVDLENFTGAFPPACTSVEPGEVVQLEESKKVLELLLKFVGHQTPPSLGGSIDFNTLIAVAEAAEKYEVYSAITISRLGLERFIPYNAKQILAFAARHDDRRLITKLYPALMDTSLDEIAKILPVQSQYFGYWSLQNSRWFKALLVATRVPQKAHTDCVWWDNHAERIQDQFTGPSSMLRIQEIFKEVETDRHPDFYGKKCLQTFKKWKRDIEEVVRQIPEFCIPGCD